jgi:subtilisin family serine protease
MIVVPGIGNLTFKAPDTKYMVVTSEWGEVPVNQVLVVLADDSKLSDLEVLANMLQGQIVGYDDSIGLYQIETSGKTEADLRDAISKAKAYTGVDLAFPNEKVDLYLFPLNDPVYSGNRGLSFEIAGVQKAWDLIKNSSIDLSPVVVGIIDDGLYKGYGEFNVTPVNIDTDDDKAELTTPITSADPKNDFSYVGSHGTGVMNILAASPDDGGLVGIASESLRENLTVGMSNFDAPQYKRSITGTLSAIDSQIGLGANILSLSWGRSDADASTVLAYKKKFKRYEERRLDVLFVCAAGNDNKPMDGTHCFPGGFNLSNIITVGSIKNDGTNLSSSMSSNNFEVSLAAPGEEAIFYKDKTLSYKNRHYGGTSMAAPMVAGAAAIIRSLNSSLNASEIKTILLHTARPTVKVGSKEVRVPQKVGGCVLAVDRAVQRVIDSKRNATLK